MVVLMCSARENTVFSLDRDGVREQAAHLGEVGPVIVGRSFLPA